MTKHDETVGEATLSLPVLFIVDADPDARNATKAALARRFAPDYQVLSADSPEAGLEALARLAERGDAMAAIDDHPGRLDTLLQMYADDVAAGLGDMPYPPDYPKMPGEPPRVQPSRINPSNWANDDQ